jgi:hypothetical protein
MISNSSPGCAEPSNRVKSVEIIRKWGEKGQKRIWFGFDSVDFGVFYLIPPVHTTCFVAAPIEMARFALETRG